MDRRHFLNLSLQTGALLALGGFATTVSASPAWINLHRSHNPLGMSPAARALLQSRTPYLDQATAKAQLLQALAHHHRLKTNRLLLGTDSLSLTQSTLQTLVHQAGRFRFKTQLIASVTASSAVLQFAQSLGMQITTVAPSESDLARDLASMRQAAKNFKGLSIVYLTNPDDPTSTLTPSALLNDWIDNAGMLTAFVLDESFAEYVESPTFVSGIDLVRNSNRNLVVIRSFSHLFGLDAQKIAYAVANVSAVEDISALRPRQAFSPSTLAAAQAALADTGFVARSQESNRRAKKIFTDALSHCGVAHFVSETNFVFFKIRRPYAQFQKELFKHRIRIAPPSKMLEDWCRIYLSTPQNMRRVATVLTALHKKGYL